MRERMKPPFYILVNDKDLEHVKFYHEFRNQGLNYEGEFGIYSKGIAHTKYGWFHLGPRRMHYIETALKFKSKIEKELNLPVNELKIVMVEKSLKDTLNRIKNSELKPVTFEGVWK